MRSWIIALSMLALLLIPLASASDFAYIVRNSAGVDNHLINEIDAAGYTSDTIYESNIPTTNLSEYRILILGDQNLANSSIIDFGNYKSLIINSYNYFKLSASNYQLGWSLDSGSKTSPTPLNIVDSSSPIVEGLPSTFYAYSTSNLNAKTSYLKGAKPSGLDIVIGSSGNSVDAVLATVSSGAAFLNGKIATERNVFFGVTYSTYWTTETRALFNNSIHWLLEGEDRDHDGYFSGADCNDTDSSIFPGAEEIPYDGIDQNCDGVDLDDVDNDGYCKSGILIQNAALQCPNEIGSPGTDCNDLDPFVNPGISDPFSNCVNDAPFITGISYDPIYNEGDLVSTHLDAIDPENDPIQLSINDSRFTVNGQDITWQTSFNDAGSYFFIINVSDGRSSSQQEISFEVLNVNRQPESTSIPDLTWNQDSSYLLNLSDYFSDADNDSLTFSISEMSNEGIIATQVSPGLFNLSSITDWEGTGWIVFSASDAESETQSNIVNLLVSHVNHPPILANQIPNQTTQQNQPLENSIDLNNYFVDIDSEMSYTFSGNDNVTVLIDSGIVSFYPNQDWYGNETITFMANDSEYSISSNPVLITVERISTPPVIGNLSCITSITEDEQYSCLIDVSDAENDQITLVIGQQNNLNCQFSNLGTENNLTYTPSQDYNGNASCQIIAQDKDGETSAVLNVNVTPVNDGPIFIGNIENISFSQTQTPDPIDLSEYFSDVDSELNYSVSGNENLSVSIDSGLVSISAIGDWYGQEILTFMASDGEYSAESNQVYVTVFYEGKPPVFNNLSCETNLTEDEQYSCDLEATDVENDSISFLVGTKHNLNCQIFNNTLTYKPTLNYNGDASCQIIAQDRDGQTSTVLNVHVNPVNDPPVITSAYPFENVIRIIEGKTQSFSITASDPENDPLNYSWYIDGEKASISTRSIILSDLTPKIYNVTAVVSDSKLEVSKNWSLIVGSMSDYTCSQVGGSICTEKQTCSTPFLGVSDSQKCCASSCEPIFSGSAKCKTINNSVSVSIKSPSSDETFDLGDKIYVELELENRLNKDQSFDVNLELYDTQKGTSISSNEETFDVLKGKTGTFTLSLDVPTDINDINDYVIFASAKDKACNQAYIPVKLQRPEHKLQIDSIDTFDNAVCGDSLDLKVGLLNVGDSDETAYVRVSNSALNISEQTSDFDINSQDSDRKDFTITIPDNAQPGNYTISVLAVSDYARDTLTKSIIIGECPIKETVSKQSAPERLQLNSQTQQTAQQEPSGKISSSLIIVGSMSLLMILASIAIITYALYKKNNKPVIISTRIK